jgi:hypothetical protein
MPPELSGIEQVVSRALRDNLGRLQRTADELAQAIADLVAACASSRPSNTLPSMLRAQTAAASLAAALEVLSRFVTAALQPAQRTPVEEEMVRLVSVQPPERPPEPSLPPRSIPTPMGEAEPSQPQASVAAPADIVQPADTVAEAAPVASPEAVGAAKPGGDGAAPDSGGMAAPADLAEPPAEELVEVGELLGAFDVASLSSEEQRMHRRANRVAKVSMQDIRLLRPEQVRLGCEHKDLCLRLRDDIEKAHKEYDRRFRPILGHPVDYFYHWMVEILADGDPEALGEYPYPSPALRR